MSIAEGCVKLLLIGLYLETVVLLPIRILHWGSGLVFLFLLPFLCLLFYLPVTIVYWKSTSFYNHICILVLILTFSLTLLLYTDGLHGIGFNNNTRDLVINRFTYRHYQIKLFVCSIHSQMDICELSKISRVAFWITLILHITYITKNFVMRVYFTDGEQ